MINIEIYTKEGSHAGYENDVGSWTLWMNATNVRGGGADVPTYLPQWWKSRHHHGDGDGDDGDDDDDASWERADVDHLVVPPRSRRAFYVSAIGGPHLRYDAGGGGDDGGADADDADADAPPRYYRDARMAILASGTAKRHGWDGSHFRPRVFGGGVHYYVGAVPWNDGGGDGDDGGGAAEEEEEGGAVLLLPGVGIVPRYDDIAPNPTHGPSLATRPSASPFPTGSPTAGPTDRPTETPTDRPTLSPMDYGYLSTLFETPATAAAGGVGQKAKVYAGNMFDLKARSDVEISSLGFHTYVTANMNVWLYVKRGGYRDAEDDDADDDEEDNFDDPSSSSSSSSSGGGGGGGGWIAAVSNMTIRGMGSGNPTYIPYGSFEPILLRRREILGVYLTSDGPYLLTSMGELDGKPHVADPNLVLYEGSGVRYNPSLVAGSSSSSSSSSSGNYYSPRIFNGVVGYGNVVVPTGHPTVDVVTSELRVANVTFVPIADTYVERRGEDDVDGGETFGYSAQLMVDGRPERVALIQFDLTSLLGDTINRPTQIMKAVLRLYSMTSTVMSGGRVSVIPLNNDDDDDGGGDGGIDEGTTGWYDTPYAQEETGTYAGSFRAVWPEKFYEIDLTSALRNGDNGPPPGIIVRIGSDGGERAAMYRSRDGGSPNGPTLTVTFAYDPDSNRPLARTFGSDPPTPSPTILPVWEDAVVPSMPPRSYFNYDPSRGAGYGPEYWEGAEPDGYYDTLRRLVADTRTNRCADGSTQSPRDLCDTNDECLEFHMPRPRSGQYGLRNESSYRPTPIIMHNKLRLSYPERRSEGEMPEPPGTDFAHNVFKSGIQDLVHIDIKVRSEHKLCGKQYDAEMQLFHVHGQEGNFEALSILIEAGGTVVGEMGREDNPHFQMLLDYFQGKYDEDAGLCLRRRLRSRARAVFDGLRGGGGGERRGRRRGGDDDGKDDRGEETADDRRDDDDDAPPSSSSLADHLYRKIRDKFESLAPPGLRRRRDARLDVWDPLEPWYAYRSIHFWGYSGSITEPPCLQGVNWRVLDVPMRISLGQYVQLKTLMFDHVDPDTCAKTSTHFDESNARPVQPWTKGGVYRCRRSDYASDMERLASGGARKGFVQREKWWGVDNYPYIEPEFPDAG